MISLALVDAHGNCLHKYETTEYWHMSQPHDLGTDYLPSELVQLLAIASDELDRHCQRARLVQHLPRAVAL